MIRVVSAWALRCRRQEQTAYATLANGTCLETNRIPSACVECLRIVCEARVIAEVNRGQEARHMVLTFSRLGS